MENLGVPSDWQIVDVYGLDPDLLATIPQPVLAVMLLFPVTENVSLFTFQVLLCMNSLIRCKYIVEICNLPCEIL